MKNTDLGRTCGMLASIQFNLKVPSYSVLVRETNHLEEQRYINLYRAKSFIFIHVRSVQKLGQNQAKTRHQGGSARAYSVGHIERFRSIEKGKQSHVSEPTQFSHG